MEHLLCRIDILEYTSLLNQRQVGIFLAATSYANQVQAAQTQSSLAHTILTTFQKILLGYTTLELQGGPCTSERFSYYWVIFCRFLSQQELCTFAS